ncbi:hypothetical protein K3495_g8897 [Podosphaera aphanis]|nr:hypothetical protein K3495_g8897 [Podosphaera aphanis]
MRLINASIEERYRREEADRAALKAQEEALLREQRIRREKDLREKALRDKALRERRQKQEKFLREKASREKLEKALREKREKVLRDKQKRASRGKNPQGRRAWGKTPQKEVGVKRSEQTDYVTFEAKARQPGDEPEASVRMPISILRLINPKVKKMDWAEEMEEQERPKNN